jgi:hypothetical protein
MLGLKLRFKNERGRPVAAARPFDTGRGREQPASVLRFAEQRGKTGAGIERGRQSQSIEPSSPTSAAVWVSPIRP